MESCLSNVDLCSQIALYLDAFDLLVLEIVSAVWRIPVERAFQFLRRSDPYHHMTYKHRNDYFSDKKMTCVVAANRRHGSNLLLIGGSFGSLHTCTVVLAETVDRVEGEALVGASLSTGSSAAVTSVNGEVLLIGGWDEETEVVLESVQSLNLREDVKWHDKGSLNRPLCFSAATTTTHGDIIVMGGGNSPYRGADVYANCFISKANDLGVQIWGDHILPSMLSKRCGHSAVTLLDDSVMVLGGYSGGFDYLNTVELLDARLDRWIALPSMSLHRSGMAAVLGPGGAVYVTGGSSDGVWAHKLCERYDPREGKKFYPVAEMNLPRGYTAGCIGSKDCFYVSSGCHDLRFQEGVECLDFRMNNWTLLKTASDSSGNGEEEDEEGDMMSEYLQRACHQMMYLL